MRALLVDDESSALSTLRGMLNLYCAEMVIVGEANDVDSAANMIEAHQPDLVFLDIQMPGGTGFQLLERVGSPKFKVIFTTAHNQYALKAIKYSALDYLLKPLNHDQLRAAVNKAINQKWDSGDVRFTTFLDNISKPHEVPKLVLPHAKGFSVVRYNEIIRCQADRNYTHIYKANGTRITASKTLKEFEDLLSEHNFMRVHQSHLVNLDSVRNYIKGRGGQIELVDGTFIDVARSRKEAFINRFF